MVSCGAFLTQDETDTSESPLWPRTPRCLVMYGISEELYYFYSLLLKNDCNIDLDLIRLNGPSPDSPALHSDMYCCLHEYHSVADVRLWVDDAGIVKPHASGSVSEIHAGLLSFNIYWFTLCTERILNWILTVILEVNCSLVFWLRH